MFFFLLPIGCVKKKEKKEKSSSNCQILRSAILLYHLVCRFYYKMISFILFFWDTFKTVSIISIACAEQTFLLLHFFSCYCKFTKWIYLFIMWANQMTQCNNTHFPQLNFLSALTDCHEFQIGGSCTLLQFSILSNYNGRKIFLYVLSDKSFYC